MMKKNSFAAQGAVEYALLIVLVAIVVIPILAVLNPAIGQTFHNIVDGVVNNDVRSLGVRLTMTVMAATRSSTPTLTPVGYVGPTSTQTPSPTNTTIPLFTSTYTPTATITLTPSATPAGGWIWCATENGTCNFSGTRQVRYGANSTWVVLSFTSTTACTNAVFTDPLVGTVKSCWYFDAAIYPTATPTFTATPIPSILSITPNTGSTLGATSVTISGNSFVAGSTTVNFGGVPATGVTCTTTSCTVTTPAHAAGAVDVTMTVGTSTVTATAGYTYVAPPVITGVSPNTGSVAGGTPITISGTGFSTTASNFAFSGTALTVTCATTTSCTATTPAHAAGAVDVTVTVSGMTNTLTNGFTYNGPSITSVTPNSGPLSGGTPITLVGNYFAPGATTITLDGVSATSVTCTTSSSCTAVTPAGTAGPANVVVTVAGVSGTSTGGFTYLAPTVTGISPSSGPLAGGTSVTITGTNFLTTGTSITIGGTPATSVVCSSTTSCTAVTPLHSAGVVSVVVSAGGGSGTLTNGYTYIAAPTITGVSPSSGTTNGGTTVTVTGTNFSTSATSFTFGGTAAVNVSCSSATSCTMDTPAHAAGSSLDVRATANSQTSAISASAKFTFVAPRVCSKNVITFNSTRGWFYVITTSNYGNITASWTTARRGTLAILSGTPLGATSAIVSTDPDTLTTLARTPGVGTSGSTGTLTITASDVAPGTYTIYFWGDQSQTSATTSGTNFVGASCP